MNRSAARPRGSCARGRPFLRAVPSRGAGLVRADMHSELPRAETQHLNTVCPFAAIGTKELTGGFSRKTQQKG